MRILIVIGIVFAAFIAVSAYACVRVGAWADRAAEKARCAPWLEAPRRSGGFCKVVSFPSEADTEDCDGV